MAKKPNDPNRHTPPKGQRPTELEGDGKGPSSAGPSAAESNPSKTGMEGGHEPAATEQHGRAAHGSPSHRASTAQADHKKG